ncbi:class I SAM-dependent methyltransferase [Chelatococcus sp. SYSU_G07232]|uniref:Class I SAM-dependent methyltransferase n=1 Tax=Chelatococcus albus TaxID=3047466 RepID=A0ABT7AFH6_9HYPH|nr:class I SAM-dependent methyltransferase [Chelatococcus sp. SYSU_G07232]MDJ1158128.1 class I SAM-dependent methyltransferase [Chelatococcus sp. SYSU_G07232]
MSRRLRRLVLGLGTLTGLATRGYFIPYRHARPMRRAPYRALLPRFEAAEPAMRTVLGEIEALAADLDRIPVDGPELRWRQSWFPRLDAAAAYALVRREKPRRIVEIGSGHSTRFLARAVSDGGLDTRIACIDPAPRATIGRLPVTHIASLAEEVGGEVVGELDPGDILFIDSSHVAMPGNDVDRLFLDLLPRLPVGALVHVHDVFLPEAYPAVWDWRGYNEQLLVGGLLQGGAYGIVFASRYAATRLAPTVDAGVLARLPLVPGTFETSLWLRKHPAD